MGAQLVGKVFAFGLEKTLTGNEFRLLTGMAYTAKDTDPVPLYWGSRELSATFLGFDVPEEGRSASGDRARHSAFETVRRATQGLITKGAIAQVRSGRIGQTAKFRILPKFTLDSLGERGNKTLGLTEEGQQNVGPQFQQNVVATDPTKRWNQAQQNVGPEEPRGTTQGTNGEEQLTYRSTSLVPVDNSEQKEIA